MYHISYLGKEMCDKDFIKQSEDVLTRYTSHLGIDLYSLCTW